MKTMMNVYGCDTENGCGRLGMCGWGMWRVVGSSHVESWHK